MTQQVLHAVYQKGVFRPTDPLPDIPEGQKVRLVVDAEEPLISKPNRPDVLELAGRVFDGLAPREIEEFEKEIRASRFSIRRQVDL